MENRYDEIVDRARECRQREISDTDWLLKAVHYLVTHRGCPPGKVCRTMDYEGCTKCKLDWLSEEIE